MRTQALTDDAVWAVASPPVARAVAAGQAPLVLRNTERDYWDTWTAAAHRHMPIDIAKAEALHFNDSATMLEAVAAGAGLCLTRACLVRDALVAGSLVRLWDGELRDGLRYYAVCASRGAGKKAAAPFLQWLAAAFPLDDSSLSSQPA